jgi:hypothetical protein
MSSSSVNVMEAIGALNAAAMPAAIPTLAMRRRYMGLSRAERASRLLTPAQICTVGPSRPSDAPEPIWNGAENEFADGFSQRNQAITQAERDFYLGNAAAGCRRGPVM